MAIFYGFSKLWDFIAAYRGAGETTSSSQVLTVLFIKQ